MRVIVKYYRSFFIFIAVLFLSFIPFDNTEDSLLLKIEHLDKIAHFFMYFSLTFVFFLDLKRTSEKKANLTFLLLVLTVIIAVSALIEIIQEYVVIGRDGSFYDLLFNGLGALFAFCCYYFCSIK